MTFQIVRRSDPSCEPKCPEWIYAAGVINRNTPAKFRRLVKTLKGLRPPVVFNSYGGDILAALELGRDIRKAKLDTAIGNTSIVSCSSNEHICNVKGLHFGFVDGSPAYCDSACAYAFAGGITRSSDMKNYIRVHAGSPITYQNESETWVDLKDKKRISQTNAKVFREIHRAMKSFGVKDEFIELAYSHSDLYIVPIYTQYSVNLVTQIGAGHMFEIDSCSKSDGSNYCAVRDH